MVEAARKYKRMVQVGTQNRSSPNVVEGMRKLKEGVIGKLYMARGMTYKMRGNLGKHRPQPAPKGLDWDAWVGPAQMVEFSNFNHHRWYWISNFASGDVANQSVHDVDKIRWGLGLDTHPTTVMSLGGRYVPAEDDDADTPNTQAFLCRWATITPWSHSSSATGTPTARPRCATSIRSWRRTSALGRSSSAARLHDLPRLQQLLHLHGPKNEPGPFKTAGPGIDWRNESIPHFRNWLGAIRSRKHEDLSADVEQGHLSCAVCHLAKISCKLGRSVHLDPKTERFVNDPRPTSSSIASTASPTWCPTRCERRHQM